MATQKSPAPHEEQEEEHNIVPDLPESVSQGKRREHRLLNALDAVDQGLLPDMVAEAYNFFFEAEIVDLRKAQSTTSPQPAFKIPDPEFFENSSIAISWEQWKDKMMNKIRAFGNSDPIVQLMYIYNLSKRSLLLWKVSTGTPIRNRTSNDQLLEDLIYKLSNELSDKMITSYTTTLTEYVKDCQKFDYLLQQLKPAKSYVETRKGTYRGTTIPSPFFAPKIQMKFENPVVLSISKTPVKNRPVYDDPARQAFSRAGACFRCHLPGHLARDCLNKI
ncbi:hypothetical protein sscle_06g050740 [Sclerotinia sclerotiorum 1980 UF-70]|uniref:CCHC-type domain-containing protein n=1 Tax=Sclerotinia sclerotiorum (strain ATCC 18683 / 1980 / Ss-1) TaxID=665079 RepID=A0A1D9Q5S9_SCLS1|nr:hypothetical protein sscle_06g050740 [Sclerotinia sclerotiorum 1980 UF-70]